MGDVNESIDLTRLSSTPKLITPDSEARSLRQNRRRSWLRTTDLVVAGIITASTAAVFGSVGWLPALLFVLAAALWSEALHLYNARTVGVRVHEWRQLSRAIVSSVASLIVIAFVFGADVPRAWPFINGLGTFAGLAVARELWRVRLTSLRRSRRVQRDTIVVGSSPEAEMLIAMLQDEPRLGHRVVHRIDSTSHSRSELLTTEVLASAARFDAESVLITSGDLEMKPLNRLCRDLTEVGIHVEMALSLLDIAPNRLVPHKLGRFPVLYLEPVHRSGWRVATKRAFDVSFSIVTLALLAPLLLILALLIRLTSDGPVIFRQERVGRDGRSFQMLKFRTMVEDAEEQLPLLLDLAEPDVALFKLRDDPRVTRVGRVLRRASLDELPQLVNVIRGEMSLVGPRPALRREMTDWPPDLYGRLKVRPGITGLWQVSGRSEADFAEYERLDLMYVDNWSLTSDFRILARTVTAVMRRAGAY